MRSASDQPPSKPQRATFRQRAAAFVVAIAVQVLLIVMLLGLAPSPMRLFRDEPHTFQLLPEPPKPAARGHTATKVRRASGGAPRRTATPPRPAATGPAPPLALIPLSRADFAASDIAALPSHHEESAAAAGGSGTGSGRDSGAAEGAGQGPGGGRLYKADFHPPPTNAELDPYLPKSMPESGWGAVVCRTAPNLRVENCQEAGDFPIGSGLSRAVRQASWQFHVLPRRLNGRSLVGEWVLITIDFNGRVGAPR